MDLGQFALNALGLGTKALAGIAVVTSVLLVSWAFFPEPFGAAGLTKLLLPYRAHMIIACLVSIVYVGLAGVSTLYKRHREFLPYKKIIETLSNEEKEFLRPLIDGESSSTYKELYERVASGLVAKNVVSRSTPLSIPGTQLFAFTIQPWAKEYLRANRRYLK